MYDVVCSHESLLTLEVRVERFYHNLVSVFLRENVPTTTRLMSIDSPHLSKSIGWILAPLPLTIPGPLSGPKAKTHQKLPKSHHMYSNKDKNCNTWLLSYE